MASSLVFLSFVILAISASCSAANFNITRLLDDFSDFSTFNALLTQTHLASEINSRQTITVLAVDNGAVSSLSGSSADVQKNVLSVHVILDYYDLKKLRAGNKSRLVTTLFQSSGLASNQMGFLNVTVDKSSGDVRLGSASPGSSLSSSVVDEVVTQPFNISILQVTSLIQPAGIENVNASSKAKAPTAKSPAKSPSKAPSKSPSKAPVPSLDADTPDADTPDADTPDPDTRSHSPSSADSPDGANSPFADGPGGSADGPAADDSGAVRAELGGCLGVVVGAVFISVIGMM